MPSNLIYFTRSASCRGVNSSVGRHVTNARPTEAANAEVEEGNSAHCFSLFW